MIIPTISDKGVWRVTKTVSKNNKRGNLPMDFAINRYGY